MKIDLPEKELRDIAEDLRDGLEAIEGVSEILVGGIRDREIWIEVEPDRLDRHTPALSQVVQSIAAKNMNVPAGKLKVGSSEYLLRTVGEFDSVDQVQEVIIRRIPGGGKIRVGDVAEVKDTFEEPTVISRLDGALSITLSVSKRSKGSTVGIVDRVHAVVEDYQQNRLPEGRGLRWSTTAPSSFATP